MSEPKHRESPQYGTKLGHLFFYLVLKLFGAHPAYGLLHVVLPYYIFILRQPRRLVKPFLMRRFPADDAGRRLFRTYLYYYRFAQTLVDQAAIGILGRKAFKIDFPDWQKMYDLSAKKGGMVLLTSHVGMWKTAMSVVDDLAVPVNFLIRLESHMDGRHFFDLAGTRSKIKVIDPTGFMGGLVEAIKVLEKGECVSIMGDRSWGSRTKTCSFLGEQAAFPITPYYLVSATNADLVLLLTVRTGALAFRIDYFHLSGGDVDWRTISKDEAIKKLLAFYVQKLEEYVDKYPYLWFNMYDFWSATKIAAE